MNILHDGHGRTFPYLRLSVTDVCNFSCTYCLPNGYQKTSDETYMRVDEIRRLVTAFTGMGTWKVRLTGGEPTVRPDFLDVAKAVADVEGIKKLAVTTNGYRLPFRAREYYDAGIRAINVSIDSLKPNSFKKITGHDRLSEILTGLDACAAAGFETIKVNAVLLKGLNDHELDDFISFAEDRAISLRFIELMRTGTNADYFKAHHLPGDIVREALQSRGWQLQPLEDAAGPANVYAKSGHKGTIGLIAPYAKDFCKTCNRLRVSARGQLQLCLFGDGGYDLRPLLQEDHQMEELQETVLRLLRVKKETHYLQAGLTGATPHLASIGG